MKGSRGAQHLAVNSLVAVAMWTGCASGPTAVPAQSPIASSIDSLYAERLRMPYSSAIELGGDSTLENARRASALFSLLEALDIASRGIRPSHANPAQTPPRPEEAARLRRQVAEDLASRPCGEECISLARHLILKEGDPDLQRIGMRVLTGIDSDSIAPVVEALLDPPDLDTDLVLSALDLAKRRHLAGLSEKVSLLSQDYRSSVRERVASIAPSLGIAAPASFDAAAYLRPLDGELREIAEMVPTEIPSGARWVRVRLDKPYLVFSEHDYTTYEAPETRPLRPSQALDGMSGWLLEESALEYCLLNQLGRRVWISKDDATAEDRSLSDEIGRQFPFVIPSTLLPGVWAYVRGDATTAVALLQPIYGLRPALGASAVREGASAHLGRITHEEMLRAFSYQGDFKRAIRLGERLGSDLFLGYRNNRAGALELARQLADPTRPPRHLESMSIVAWANRRTTMTPSLR